MPKTQLGFAQAMVADGVNEKLLDAYCASYRVRLPSAEQQVLDILAKEIRKRLVKTYVHGGRI